jgi:carbon monoxide dehydrogenase subunit G
MTVTSQIEIAAEPAQVWAVISDLNRLGDWLTNHVGFAGDVPTDAGEGTEYVEKVRVLGMPNELRWVVTSVEEGSRIVQEGKGPMGISIRGVYTLTPTGQGTTVALEQSFSGATVFAIKGQLEREVKKILDESLANLSKVVTAG